MSDTTELDALLDDAKEQWHFWCISQVENLANGGVKYENMFLRTHDKAITKNDLKLFKGAVMNVSYLGYMTNEEFGW